MSQLIRKSLTEFLTFFPVGTWPEFCAQTRQCRRRILSNKDTSALFELTGRTFRWYVLYVFQYLTHPWRAEPTFFLSGFPKCGTTYLASLLTSLYDVGHPTRLAPLGKETVHYRKDQALHSFMPLKGFYPLFLKKEHIMDASVSYSLDPGAMNAVHKDYPDTKVILVVRDQISAMESGINYYNVRLWQSGPAELTIFNDVDAYKNFNMDKVYQAIDYANQLQCSLVRSNRTDKINALFADDKEIANRVMPLVYDMWIAFILDIFPKENVLVLDFYETTNHTETVLSRVTEFLGIKRPVNRMDLDDAETNKHASRKVFKFTDEARAAIKDVFFEHNEKLKLMTGVDLNRHL